MEGRKPCGGKIEVKIRIREPFGAAQFKTTQEKWLVIDQFLAWMLFIFLLSYSTGLTSMSADFPSVILSI